MPDVIEQKRQGTDLSSSSEQKQPRANLHTKRTSLSVWSYLPSSLCSIQFKPICKVPFPFPTGPNANGGDSMTGMVTTNTIVIENPHYPSKNPTHDCSVSMSNTRCHAFFGDNNPIYHHTITLRTMEISEDNCPDFQSMTSIFCFYILLD